MRSRAVLAAAFTLTIGLSACGKYGSPERTVPRRPPPPPAAAEPEPQEPEEEIPAPAELDGTEADEESDQ
jgi:hypothetical protein